MAIDTSKSKWAKWNAKSKKKKLTPTLAYTLKLFQEGLSIEEITKKREFKQDSIERQIIELITRSFIDISNIIDAKTYKEIIKAMTNQNLSSLKPIKEKLPDDITWFQLKCVLASINAKPQKL